MSYKICKNLLLGHSGVQMVVFFYPGIQIVLFDTPGVPRCHNTLFLSSPHF